MVVASKRIFDLMADCSFSTFYLAVQNYFDASLISSLLDHDADCKYFHFVGTAMEKFFLKMMLKVLAFYSFLMICYY